MTNTELEQEESLYDELQNGGSTDVEIDETNEQEEQLPIDTFQKVVYFTNQFSINNLIEMIDSKDLDLGDTDFITKDNIEFDLFHGIDVKYQRNFVWEPKTQTKFIESVILNLPIPNLIFYTKENKISFNVIDGKQRLTTLYLFIKGKIGINKKFLNIDTTELVKPKDEIVSFIEKNNNGKSIDSEDYINIENKDLDNFVYYFSFKEDLQKRLKFYRLYVTTIDLDSKISDHLKTKLEYEIFDRLNTGSVNLSWQEIRNNIIADSYLQVSLRNLSKSDSFKNIYYSHKEGITDLLNIPGNYTKKKRMYDQELLLRTIFFLDKIILDDKYLIEKKDIIFNINNLDVLSENDDINKVFKISKFYSMKRNLDQVVEDLKNDNNKNKITKYIDVINKTFDELYSNGGSNICRKDGTIAFNVSLFESIFIPLLYCNYYGINIGDNINKLTEIKKNISDDLIFKQIVDKGGSTKKDYIIYKILLGLKNFIN